MKTYPTFRSFVAPAILLAAFACSAQAQTFVYTDFSTIAPTDLVLNGSASITNGAVASDGKVLRLTPANYWQAGSAFSTALVPLTSASFSTAFTFRITDSGGISDSDGSGADGLVFVVENVSNSVGGAGVGIGYQGINHSLGIEFDTYNNGGPDHNSGNHVAINTNGILSDSIYATIPTRMNNGALWYAWVDYSGATNNLQVRLSDTSTRPTTALLETSSIDLASILGTSSAYVGFTSGTGAAYGNHDITSWQFNNTYRPITNVGDVPDGGSTAFLLGSALVPLLMVIRRRRRGA